MPIGRFALTLLAVVFSLPASAQTAEETVAYLIHGVEDGIVVPDPAGKITIELTSSSPAVYIGKVDGKNEEYTLRYVQKKACHYEFTLTLRRNGAETKERQEGRIDFNKITGIKLEDETLKIEGAGFCFSPDGGACEVSPIAPGGRLAVAERIDKAYRYLRSNICKARAF